MGLDMYVYAVRRQGEVREGERVSGKREAELGGRGIRLFEKDDECTGCLEPFGTPCTMELCLTDTEAIARDYIDGYKEEDGWFLAGEEWKRSTDGDVDRFTVVMKFKDGKDGKDSKDGRTAKTEPLSEEVVAKYTETEAVPAFAVRLDEIFYWRKAHAIHDWIYERKGIDGDEEDCVLLDADDIRDLAGACREVLADREKVEAVFPQEGGYDAIYFNHLERTAGHLENAVRENGDAEAFVYLPSW